MLEPHPPSNIVNKKITNEKMAREKKGTITIIYFAPFLPTRLRQAMFQLLASDKRSDL